MPPESTVGTHGLGAFGENRREATVGVLVGRNPTLLRFSPQGAGVSIEDFPHVKKKRGTTSIVVGLASLFCLVSSRND